MGSLVKEQERIERAIRGLLKLPDNRRCINCNSLGPQYVCTTFWTFVCTNCSGIHREFTHRVKSISMAKFTAEEVSALQAGGNERARQIYFKDWDPQRNPYPDSSNLNRLRSVIKSVYVDKKYSGESRDKISRLRLADTDSSSRSNNNNAYSIGSRSPHYGDKSERSCFGKNGDGSLKSYFEERRSPRHVRPSSRPGGLQKSPVRFEIVDDRFRDDRGVKRYDSRSLREWRGCTSSPDLLKNRDSPSFPVVRPMRELVGDDAPRLHVGNVVKVAERKDADDDPSQNQTATPSSKKTAEHKEENQASLIDFTTESGPPDPKLAPENEQKPPSSDSNCQSSSELPASQKATEDPATTSLEALLFGLPVPSVFTETNSFEVCNRSDISSTASVGENPAASLENQISRTLDNVDSFAALPTNVPAKTNDAGPSLSVLPAAADSFNTEDSDALCATPNNQLAVVSAAPNIEQQSGDQSTLDVSKPLLGTSAGVDSGPHQQETNSSERRELPEDLFTGGPSFVSPQVHGWQSGLPRGFGFGMPYYHNPLTMGAVQYAARPTNPFDLGSETEPVQASQVRNVTDSGSDMMQMPFVLPSMVTMQGALPQVLAPRGFSETSMLAGHSPGLMASQSPFHAAAMAPRSPSITSNLSSGAYMAQQMHMNTLLPPRMQGGDGVGPVGNEGNLFNSTNAFHQGRSGHPSLANPNSFHPRGNPFE